MIKPILILILCALIIGLEREVKQKSAGIKTTLFIMLASFLYTLIGFKIGSYERIISQVVSGVGFIGGGVIIYNRGAVAGLTSAAIVWLSSAIGIMCSINMLTEAVVFSILVAGLDLLIDQVKKRLK